MKKPASKHKYIEWHEFIRDNRPQKRKLCPHCGKQTNFQIQRFYRVKIRMPKFDLNVSKNFQVPVYKTKAKALAAAMDFRDAILIEHDLMCKLTQETRGRKKK